MKKQSWLNITFPLSEAKRGLKAGLWPNRIRPGSTRQSMVCYVMFIFYEHNFLIDWIAPGILSEHCKSISLVHIVTKPIDFLHLFVLLE